MRRANQCAGRGDGTGVDIWPASKLVFDAAVEKAYGGAKKIEWKEVLAGGGTEAEIERDKALQALRAEQQKLLAEQQARDRILLNLYRNEDDLVMARDGKVAIEDLQGGTFTVTNLGAIGGTHFTPIVNYPEVAILGMGKVQEKPVVRDGQIVVRKMLPLTLAFDHRIADGADAARFVGELVRQLSDPNLLLLEMGLSDMTGLELLARLKRLPAYNPFVLDVTDVVKAAAPNRLAVRVLNPTHEPIDGVVLNQTPHRNKVIPYHAGASYNHGGIVDSVELLIVPHVRIDGVTAAVGYNLILRRDDKASDQNARWLALLVTTLTFLFSVAVFSGYDPNDPGAVRWPGEGPALVPAADCPGDLRGG